jgi:hypothetical protein
MAHQKRYIHLGSFVCGDSCTSKKCYLGYKAHEGSGTISRFGLRATSRGAVAYERVDVSSARISPVVVDEILDMYVALEESKVTRAGI